MHGLPHPARPGAAHLAVREWLSLHATCHPPAPFSTRDASLALPGAPLSSPLTSPSPVQHLPQVVQWNFLSMTGSVKGSSVGSGREEALRRCEEALGEAEGAPLREGCCCHRRRCCGACGTPASLEEESRSAVGEWGSRQSIMLGERPIWRFERIRR